MPQDEIDEIRRRNKNEQAKKNRSKQKLFEGMVMTDFVGEQEKNIQLKQLHEQLTMQRNGLIDRLPPEYEALLQKIKGSIPR